MRQHINHLHVSAEGKTDLLITRLFNAPRNLVFDTMTKPELLKRWFHGPPGWTLNVCEVDLRVNGKYRYVWNSENGSTLGMGGIFTEIEAPKRYVATEAFDQSWYPGEAVNITTLIEQGEQTKLHLLVRYQSKEARDGVLRSPMEQGLSYGYDRLEEYLETL
ncbi:SRPBCC family protein [Leptospira ellisii]|uniref:ATPase n=1 Tax=Leptospira ellisii TaxID=2023197 RepID=A0A2N0B528_9LEPT|nr:SRPBCC family protein [Leptospira ellisii]MDV6235106.1 SRPBCC family protein [Leptospira ellisii]PJZ91657.1 ATPase [Leptospira ellisii]PKA04570.1 ATPase [Leptospira ellisii]